MRYQFIFYQDTGLDLPRTIKREGLSLDLITIGYALVPTSVTVGPYSWFEKHSPTDIPLADLGSPPEALLEWWLSLKETPRETKASNASGAWSNLQSTISEGTRNDREKSRMASRLWLLEIVAI